MQLGEINGEPFDYYNLIAISSQTLRCSLDAGAPPVIAKLELGELTFNRVVELQAELCDSIFSLSKAGYFRPAHAVLRSVLESMAVLVWAGTQQRYMDLFNEGREPNIKAILEKIGWGAEYDRTYNWLSTFVHGRMEQADFYRKYDAEVLDETSPFPEVLPDAEYYLLQSPSSHSILTIRPMNPEETEGEYLPYLSAKVLDIVASGLLALYKLETPTLWWPTHAVRQLHWLCDNDPHIQGKMLMCL